MVLLVILVGLSARKKLSAEKMPLDDFGPN